MNININKMKISNNRWIYYNYVKGNDNYEYSLILDTQTGLLWVDGDQYKYSFVAKKKEDIKLSFEDGRFNWRLPTFKELENVVTDHSFPLHAEETGNHCLYSNICQKQFNHKRGLFPFWCLNKKGEKIVANLDSDPISIITDRDNDENLVIAVTDEFKIEAENYMPFSEVLKRFKLNITGDRRVCEHLLKLYNSCVSLSIIFQLKYKYGVGLNLEGFSSEIISLYHRVEFFEENNMSDINAINKAVFSFFDYDDSNDAPLEYCNRIKEWIEMLLNILDEGINDYKGKIDTINADISDLKNYRALNESLSSEESNLLSDRINYFAEEFSIDTVAVQTKLMSVKEQAEKLEKEIFDTIDNGNSIAQLGKIETQRRANFGTLSQVTARLLTKFLQKIERLSNTQPFAKWICTSVQNWTDNYISLKTIYHNDFRTLCEQDGIEEEIWQKWYADWQFLRFKIEQKVQPIIEKELHQRIEMIEEDEISVAQQIIAELTVYRDAVDTFYREERKGIYQNFVFQSNGDVQDKLESESKLYKITADFQRALQDIVFNCAKAEDRIFILNWANSLLDIQIDDVLSIISDHDLDKISDTILTEFSELKKKNYEIYLADAKSYGEEQARRDKQFNSLLFKMRKGLR